MRTNKIFGLFLGAIVLLYIAFMAYFCSARPNEPNIIIERKLRAEKTKITTTPEKRDTTVYCSPLRNDQNYGNIS